MPGIDLLISRRFSTVLKNSLDKKTLSKLERELFLQDGMSVKLAIEHYDIFQNFLRAYNKNNYQKIQNDCISKIFSVEFLNGNYYLKIVDNELSDKLLNYFGDPETRKILYSIMGKKLTISEILKSSKVLKSSAYRKIENLLLDGLILESGKILTKNKRVSQYSCVFNEVRFLITSGKLNVECTVSKSLMADSSIFNSGLLNEQLGS